MPQQFTKWMLLAALLLSGRETFGQSTNEPLNSTVSAEFRFINLKVEPSEVLANHGYLYVASWRDRKVLQFKEATGQLVNQLDEFDRFEHQKLNGEITSGISRPDSMVIANSKLFINQTFGSSILVVDARTLKPFSRILIGPSSNGELAVAPDESRVYFASNRDNAFFMIDPKCQWTQRIPYPKGARGIGAIAVSPEHDRIYLGIQRGAREANSKPPSKAAGPINPLKQTYPGPLLAVFDLRTGSYVNKISIGDTLKSRADDSSIPTGMTFDPNSNRLYISMGQCTVGAHVYEIDDDKLKHPIAFKVKNSSFPWAGSRDVIGNPTNLFVANRANQELAIVDLETHKVSKSLSLGGSVTDLAISHHHLFICQPDRQRIAILDLDKN